MRAVLLFAMPLFAWCGEEFMSLEEYGMMLYEQPRGVSCALCHGKRGEGKDIARYKDAKKGEVLLYGPDIREISVSKLKEALLSSPSVMPRYYLTDEEIKALAAYLKSVGK